ncbi:MAG: hypothetical protein JWO32_543 [Bacteroidetes bacterium]|nr:hypothetical protein [Bacteroidota bacterium]
MKNILLLVSCLFLGFTVQAQRDILFAVEAANANLLEARLGELAMQNGFSDAVKQLGQTMKEEHSAANANLMEITTKKEIALPTSIDEKGQRIFERLSTKNAEAFDKAYTKYLVKDHKKDVCRFKKEAKRGKDAELKQYASSTVQMLEHHLELSKNACSLIKSK